MGLDVYLYHCADRATAKAAEEEYQELSGAEWDKSDKNYEDYTQEEKDAISATNKATAERLGLTGKYESHHSVKEIEQKSSKYPDHLFKVGYFRSSYNDGGIERIMGNLGIDGLYGIFDNGKDTQYEFTPNWPLALSKVRDSIKRYKKHLGSIIGDVSITKFAYNPFISSTELPNDEETVMTLVKTQLEREVKQSYSTREGNFFLDEPLQVIAVVAGTQKGFMNTLKGLPETGEPCFYVASRRAKKDGEEEWYLQALEIVEETCDFVLSQPDPQNYYVHWSS